MSRITPQAAALAHELLHDYPVSLRLAEGGSCIKVSGLKYDTKEARAIKNLLFNAGFRVQQVLIDNTPFVWRKKNPYGPGYIEAEPKKGADLSLLYVVSDRLAKELEEKEESILLTT